jgi:hypothetical protein
VKRLQALQLARAWDLEGFDSSEELRREIAMGSIRACLGVLAFVAVAQTAWDLASCPNPSRRSDALQNLLARWTP